MFKGAQAGYWLSTGLGISGYLNTGWVVFYEFMEAFTNVVPGLTFRFNTILQRVINSNLLSHYSVVTWLCTSSTTFTVTTISFMKKEK